MKTTISTVLFALFFGAAYSQTIIPKVGISLNNLSASKDVIDPATDKQKMLIGMVLGAGVEFSLSDKISIQPELLFAQKGMKVTADDPAYTYNQSGTLNYFDIPVLVKIKFSDFYFNVGPSIGFGMGGKYSVDFKDKIDPANNFNDSGKIKFGKEPANYQGTDYYIDNGTNIGLQFGAGYKIAGKILLDVRYGLGITNLYDKPAGSTMDPKSKTNSFQFSVGYPISLGGK